VSDGAPAAKQPLLKRVWNNWATKSLAVGAVATLIDIALGTVLLTAFQMPTRFAAMTGTVLGASFTFVANKYFAFKDHKPKLGHSALRFVLVTLGASLVHGQLVVWLRDRFGVPYVPSKMISDVAVFTFGQLLLLRYVVFPKAKASSGDLSAPSHALR
jgi:putative flippase GtrA